MLYMKYFPEHNRLQYKRLFKKSTFDYEATALFEQAL